MSLRVRACVVLANLLLSAPLWAAHPKLEAGRAAFDQGDFGTALVHLSEAANDPKLSEEELVQLSWLQAASLFAMDQRPDAKKAIEKLLRLRPLYEPSELDASPALMAFFDTTANAWREREGVLLGQPSMKEGMLLVFLRRHADRVASVGVSARVPGQVAYKQFVLPVEGTRAVGALLDVQLWELVAGPGALELVLEARNAAGVPIARLGSAQSPVRLPIAERERVAALALAPPAPEGAPLLPGESPPPKTHTITATDPDATGAPTTAAAPATTRTSSGPIIPGLVVAGVLGASAGVGLLTAVVSAIVAGAAYIGLWLQPQRAGIERDPMYRSILITYVGGLVFTAVMLALSGVVALLAAGSGAASFFIGSSEQQPLEPLPEQ